MRKIIDKYRKEAFDLHVGVYSKTVSWRQAILEAIFRPRMVVKGKEDMSHLHPNIKNLHLPDKVYISDWRKYRVEDHPALMNFQRRCHAAGLHDPWLRNFAYGFYPNKYWYRSKLGFVTQGCLTGFGIALALYLGEKLYDRYYPYTYQHTKEYIEKYGTGERHH